jgi:hypothetical protein
MSKTEILKNWSKENWPLLLAFSVVFLLALSALIVAIMTTQRSISSDIVRNVDKDDTNVNMSLSAGKSLRKDIDVLTEMQNNAMATLTHMVDVVQGKILNESTKEITPKINGKVIGNRAVPSTVSYFNQNGDVSTILCNMNLVTTSTGVSPTTIVFDLKDYVDDENIVLQTVSPIVCSSTNFYDVPSWQQTKPVINGTIVKLVNPNFYATLRGANIKLIFSLLAKTVTPQENTPTKN